MSNKFNFKESNCYTLAQDLRKAGGLEPLPDFYSVMISEEEAEPEGLILEELKKQAVRVHVPADFDLVLLGTETKYSLGTYVQGSVYCMTESGITVLPFNRIIHLLHSIWRY